MRGYGFSFSVRTLKGSHCLTFETHPQVVEEMRTGICGLKELVRRTLEQGADSRKDCWMNINQLREYHPDHVRSPIFDSQRGSVIGYHQEIPADSD